MPPPTSPNSDPSTGLVWSIHDGTMTAYAADGTATKLGAGYAGNGPDLNNPDSIAIHMHGPLPVGEYAIGAPVDKPESVGAFALPLTPDPANQMFGRSAFYCHGGNGKGDRSASDGCIVLPRPVRTVVATYSRLVVVP